MVCVPCFIVPLLIFLWHKFIQPYVLRFWNPWAVKDADGNVKTEFPFKCEGGVCMFSKGAAKKTEDAGKDDCDKTQQGEESRNDSQPASSDRLKVD